METSEIKLHKWLQKKNFSDGDSEEFVALLKSLNNEHLATKEDLAKTKSQLLWDMFAFWLAQIGVFLGFAYKIF